MIRKLPLLASFLARLLEYPTTSTSPVTAGPSRTCSGRWSWGCWASSSSRRWTVSSSRRRRSHGMARLYVPLRSEVRE
jgi:hypothetical protein